METRNEFKVKMSRDEEMIELVTEKFGSIC